MSTPRKRRRPGIPPIIKFLFSIAALCLILYLAGFAFRFCMGLFMTGEDYIVQLPGQDSPIAETLPQKDPEKEEAEQSDVVTITGRATVLAAGDLMTHLPIVRSGETGDGYDFSYIFQYVQPYVENADYAVVNLETTLSGRDGKEYTGYPKFNAPDQIAGGAAKAGFDMLLTANNHCYDYGTQGLQRTLEVVKSYNLDTLGVTAAAEDAKYRVVDLNGIKVGMVNYTYAEINDDRNLPAINGLPTDKKAAGLINAFDYDNTDMFYAEMENHISGMQAAGADAIILYIHWGDEFSVATTNSQRAIAQKLCDMGVDIIAGSHPHVIEPIQLLTSADGSRQTVCLYSMGNFVSNQRADNIALTTGHSEDSVMLQVTFVEYSNGEVHVEAVDLIPTWMLIRGSGDSRKYYVLPLDEAVSDWKGTFELSKEQLADAESSLKRTNALVQSDLTAIQSALDNQTAARNQAYGIFNGGVG